VSLYINPVALLILVLAVLVACAVYRRSMRPDVPGAPATQGDLPAAIASASAVGALLGILFSFTPDTAQHPSAPVPSAPAPGTTATTGPSEPPAR
jgi:hypothetical protein